MSMHRMSDCMGESEVEKSWFANRANSGNR